MLYTPYPHQEHAKKHILSTDFCGLFLEMGLGKTVITGTALNELIFERFEVGKVLIIAPKRVAETVWTDEIQKWDHLRHFKTSLVLGTEVQRKKALLQKANLYITNRENVTWLVGHYGPKWPFETVVIDELSSFKSAKAMRFKALRKVRPLMKRVIGLTGTPAPNGLMDLWSQFYLLDRGERLGETVTGYRERYFKPDKRNGSVVYTYKPLPESEKAIYSKIGDIAISMKTEDYLKLPEKIDIDRRINFSPAVMEKYLRFEKDEVLKLSELQEITPANAAGMTNKLLQFTNGAVYDDTKNYHEIHTEKIETLIEDIEAANGEPVLVFYSYQHDLKRLLHYLKAFKPVQYTGPQTKKDWNDKKISVMLTHPQSTGHGLNLQYGGCIIEWFGLPWGLEPYEQGSARLHRQGQINAVRNSRLIVAGTIDEDVLESLSGKKSRQDALMHAVKVRIDKYLS